ncbi:MAG: T9SS type A sorting domain-containing protein [Candidatus Marinimicrobia bacterium]|nr:T9SS type A sorting domain-containing protein [Candidatus Neomarinimicrobiota bacterium]MCF7828386.1 T9SS type A sorting domain-containing protein [Candidatus Neomarinimicrobiota bacterium]MCF7881020.1 T9SS type A sorting domain-containing protein [Candidatus Neomarinimicrobiota bacterium]
MKFNRYKIGNLPPILFFVTMLMSATSLSAQTYSTEVTVVNGGSGVMTGYLAPAVVGEERQNGSHTVLVGQPFVSTGVMSGNGLKSELGFWSPMLRRPGVPLLKASYDIFPDKINLRWSYDPNIPPATILHDIYRNSTQLYDDYPITESTYEDAASDLNVGTEYVYHIEGKNVFGPAPVRGEAIGKTSTSGYISGNIKSKVGTKIPEVKLVLTPNWGYSLFFDGMEDYMTVPDADVFEFANDQVLPEATLEFWALPSTVANQILLSKSGLWNLELVDNGTAMHLAFTLNGSQVFLTDNTVNVNEWTHIALVKSGSMLTAYLNGTQATVGGGMLFMEFNATAENTAPLIFASDGETGFFRGAIDDFRTWDFARGEETIARDYNRYLYYRTGEIINHTGMTSSMNFDFGSGTTVTNAVNQTLSGTVYGVSTDTWASNLPPVYATAFTDSTGYYKMENINFGGNGTLFRLTPSKLYHEFDVEFLDVSLNETNPAALNQNFTVVNLMSITGYVYFDTSYTEGVQCGEKGVQIKVNGAVKTTTDADGFYRVEVEPGADVTIRPEKNSRDSLNFRPTRYDFTEVVENKTANFKDTKTRFLRGRVSGGSCGVALGPKAFASVQVSPANNKFTKTFAVDAGGNFTFPTLPPQAYTVSVQMDQAFIEDIDNWSTIDTWFKNNGKSIDLEKSYSLADSAWGGEEDTLDFTYRSPMQVEIAGFDTLSIWNPDKQKLEVNKYFVQNRPHILELSSYEEYYGGECPVDTGTFQIFDYISDRWSAGSEDTVEVAIGPTGTYDYEVIPGQPDVISPYKKKISVRAIGGIGQTKSVTKEAVVLGTKPGPMQFTTTAPDIPFLILRRPPGDQSFAEFTRSQAQSTEFGIDIGSAMGYEREVSASLGTKFTTVVGFGVSTELSVEAKYEMTAGFSSTFSLSSSKSQAVSISTQSTYQTGTGVDVAGNHGDLDMFVGGALNLLYGKTTELGLKKYTVGEQVYDGYGITTPVMFVPDGFATTFIYTRKHIEEILIPELRDIARNTDSDSLRETTLESIARWNQVLDREKSLRWITQDTVNYSFDGNAGPFTQSRTSEVSESYTMNVGLEINSSFAQEVGFEINEGFGASTTERYSFGFNMGRSATSTKTVSNTSSFTLDDDDDGDRYTVDVANDPVYGTPVFRVVSGISSCPYEEWRNAEDSVVTVPRDKPTMAWDASTNNGIIDDALPSEPVDLKVWLRNEKPESRTYYLSIVQSSNPLGAEITINGVAATEANPFPVVMDSMEQQFATVRVWRGSGDHYEYNGLTIKFAPECESNYAGVTSGFTLPFTVNFAKPCTDAEFYDLEESWVLNIADKDTLDFLVTGYDLGQSYFETLLLQYQPVGSDQWFTVSADTLYADTLRIYDQQVASMHWPIPEGFTDGKYDIRLRSVCLENTLTNEMPSLRGTVDRKKPQILGAPEPKDEVLNMSDEIAINFTEAINPASVTRTDVKLYDGQAGGEITDIEVTVSENRLVIIPQIQNKFMENHHVTATVYGYEDLNGNPGDTLTWKFLVDRNPVAWNQRSTEVLAFTDTTNEFRITLNNNGSKAQPFELVDVPSWLIAAPTNGELNPGGSFDIHFEVDPNLDVGEYTNTLFARTPEGDEPLDMKIVSMCPYPDWDVNPYDYEYSMTVTADVLVQGTKSTDHYDRMGAFIDGQPVGFGHIEYVSELNDHRTYLTVYSNTFSGDTVRFHLWDRTGCVEFWEMDTTLVFTNDAAIGSLTEPLTMNASGVVAQNLAFPEGFKWFSVNVKPEKSNLNNVLEGLAPEEGDRIISQEAYAQFQSSTNSWVGPLTEVGLDAGTMYVADLSSGMALPYIGRRVWADTAQIPLTQNWNWLGYLPNRSMNVNVALSQLHPGDGDLVKDQVSFAEYAEGLGWIGNLTDMLPGAGYKIRLVTADTLVYPLGSITSPGLAKITVLTPEFAADSLPEVQWVVENPYLHEHTMTLTTVIYDELNMVADPYDMVAALIDGEVRGTARPMFIPGIDEPRIFLSIQGDSREETPVELRIWDNDKERIYRTAETFPFRPESHEGSVTEPFTMTQTALALDDPDFIPEEYVLSQNYPNPFNPTTVIGYGLPEASRVTLRIYNIRGQVVKTMVNDVQKAGYYRIRWDGTDQYGHDMASGMYIMRMRTRTYTKIRKMVLVR